MKSPDSVTISATGYTKNYSVPLADRVSVWLTNLWHWRTAWAVRYLSKQLQRDKAFRDAWQSNIAMPIYDATHPQCTCPTKAGRYDAHYPECPLYCLPLSDRELPAYQCNAIADRLMKHLFDA